MFLIDLSPLQQKREFRSNSYNRSNLLETVMAFTAEVCLVIDMVERSNLQEKICSGTLLERNPMPAL